MSIDGVEADKDPKRLTELERQREKTKWMAEAREKRERLKSKGERDEIFKTCNMVTMFSRPWVLA